MLENFRANVLNDIARVQVSQYVANILNATYRWNGLIFMNEGDNR